MKMTNLCICRNEVLVIYCFPDAACSESQQHLHAWLGSFNRVLHDGSKGIKVGVLKQPGRRALMSTSLSQRKVGAAGEGRG